MAMRAMPRTATPYNVKMKIMSAYISNKKARTQKRKKQTWRPLPGGSPCLQETPSCLCPSYLSCPYPPPSLSPSLHSAHCRYAEAAGLSVHFQNLKCKWWEVDLLRDWNKQAKGESVSIIMGFIPKPIIIIMIIWKINLKIWSTLMSAGTNSLL